MANSRTVRCPQCKKETVYDDTNPYRPFCSNRCSLLDLGQWADEHFKIPALNDAPPADQQSISASENDEESSHSPPRHKLN